MARAAMNAGTGAQAMPGCDREHAAKIVLARQPHAGTSVALPWIRHSKAWRFVFTAVRALARDAACRMSRGRSRRSVAKFASDTCVGTTLRSRNQLCAFDCQQLIRPRLRSNCTPLGDLPEPMSGSRTALAGDYPWRRLRVCHVGMRSRPQRQFPRSARNLSKLLASGDDDPGRVANY